ncbi:MAG: response regulator [Candidatus Methylomirabilales bacterium]
MKRARVLLADDHTIVAEGLRSLLEPEFELVGTVQDGRALVAATEKLSPDVIVVDISMPLLNGIEAASRLKKAGSPAKIIFLTMHPDPTYAIRALDAGASAYVLKHSAASELVKAIREALKGRVYVTPLIANDVLESVIDGSHQRQKTSFTLTPRQREVLQLVAEGRSAKEIASLLNISPRTVEFHKYRIMEDLEIRSNAELVQYAIRHGIASA